MNAQRLNTEIKIAQLQWGPDRVDWTKAPDYRIVIRKVKMPDNVVPDRIDVMIRVPQDFGHPAGPGKIRFFHNVYLEQGVRVRDRRTGRLRRIPRYYDQPLDGTRWHFLCVHKASAAVDEGTTILDFIRTVQIYLRDCLAIG